MFLLCLLVVPWLFILYGFYLWYAAKKYTHLPGKLGSEIPIIGNLYWSLRYSFWTFQGYQSHLRQVVPKLGGLCCLWFYGRPTVVISDPYIAEKVASHPFLTDKEPYVYENLYNFWRGTFTWAYSDKEWKQRRREINMTMKSCNLERYHTTFVKVSLRLVNKLKKEDGMFNVHRLVLMSAVNSILETHFGCDFDVLEDNELYDFLVWGGKLFPVSFINPVIGAFYNTLAKLSFYTQPLKKLQEMCIEKTLADFKERRAGEGDDNQLFSEAVVGRNISRKNVTEAIGLEIAELIMTGSHTIGSTVSCTLVFLSTLPDIQEKAWLEQREIFGSSDRSPSSDDVKSMQYLDRIFKEVLRFISPPILTKRSKGVIEIDGKIVPRDSTILIHFGCMKMDSRFWENPLKFDPDRFLYQDAPKNLKQAFSFFGTGIRNCPGSQYGLNEAKVMVSIILRNFKLVTNKMFEDINLHAEVLMEIKGGYNISLVDR